MPKVSLGLTYVTRLILQENQQDWVDRSDTLNIRRDTNEEIIKNNTLAKSVRRLTVLCSANRLQQTAYFKRYKRNCDNMVRVLLYRQSLTTTYTTVLDKSYLHSESWPKRPQTG